MYPVQQTLANPHDQQRIALELARNELGMQYPIRDLLKRIGVTEEEFKQYAKNEHFKKLVKKTRTDLEKDNQGIKLKSAIALEDSIEVLYRLIRDPDTPHNVVVQGIKQLADMAGVTKQETQQQVGSGFVVNIDLSGLKEAQEKAAKEVQASVNAVIEGSTA